MLRYKLYQNNNPKSSTRGMWYGKATVGSLITVDQLAEEISASCTVTESDILAVISALVKTMGRHISNGDRVKIERFGSFRAGIKTKPAAKAEDFTAANVKSAHLLFYPEIIVDNNKKHITKLLQGLKVGKMEDYHDPSLEGKEDIQP